MNEPVRKPNQPLLIVLGAAFGIAAIAALVFFVKFNEAKAEAEQAKAQLAQAVLKLAELQPLADKARQIPIATKFTKLKGGDNALAVSNASQKPLRLAVTVTRANKPQTFSPVIAPGKFWLLNGLYSGETVDVASDGYDSQQLTVP